MPLTFSSIRPASLSELLPGTLKYFSPSIADLYLHRSLQKLYHVPSSVCNKEGRVVCLEQLLVYDDPAHSRSGMRKFWQEGRVYLELRS